MILIHFLVFVFVVVVVVIYINLLESLIGSQVHINNVHFGFMPGRITTDTIYILCQMHFAFNKSTLLLLT